MTSQQQEAIGEFFALVERLKDLGVVRSDRYLGDIAEFLCSREFEMTLASNRREPGHDGLIGSQRVQVKFHGGKSTTVECGNPSQYQQLIVVLGPSSVLRPSESGGPFLFYRIPSQVVQAMERHGDGKYRYTKGQLPQQFLVGSADDA